LAEADFEIERRVLALNSATELEYCPYCWL